MKQPIKTQREPQEERLARLKAAMCELLECTPEQYAEFQYQAGLKYLKHYMPNDPTSADNLSRSTVFWNWWRNHWANRDEHFMCLHDRCPIHRRDVKIELYTKYNDGKDLAENIHPNSVVLNESYAVMISELIKTETAKA